MKKHIGVGLLLLAVLCAQPNEIFAACDAKLTLDLEKQSRDHFTNGQVSVLQNFLKDQGFFQSDVTGFFGNDTYAAVRGYQAAHNISPVSGFVGALTRASINSAPCPSSEVSVIEKIIQANQAAVLGMSTTDSHVAAAPKSTVTVTSPNGGEKYATGESISIRIKSKRYYSDDVVSLYVVPVKGSEGESYTLREKLAGNSFKWKIPETIISGEYVVRAQLMSCYGGSDTCSLTGDDSDTSIYIQGVDAPPMNGIFNRDLSLGSAGTDVVKLQQMLVANGYLVMEPGVALGYFGSRTQTAVARWQAANGIYPADGYFGPTSRAVANASVVYPIVVSQAEIVGSKNIYDAASEPKRLISFTVKGVDSNQQILTPEKGFNVQANIEQKDFRGGWSTVYINGDALSINAVYGERTKTWSVSFPLPIDSAKEYRANASVYCANSSKGCSSSQIDMQFPFRIVSTPSVVGLTAQSLEIDGLKKTYSVGESVTYKVEGILSNAPSGSSDTTKPSQGFGARAAIEEYDAVGKQWFIRSNLINTADMYATGVWDGKDRWDIKMKAPLDATKTYRVRTIVYCADKTLGCVTGAGSFALSHESITVKPVVTPPTTPSVDAQVRTILHGIKGVADKYYVAHNNSYWGSVAGQDVCDVTGEHTVGVYMEEVAKLGGWPHEKDDHGNEANSTPSRIRVWCHVSAQEWAIVAPLKDRIGGDVFYCVDSVGSRRTVPNLGLNMNTCPASAAY